MGKTELSVRAILADQAPKEAPVTVKGWVRTRRDSKAGISFVQVSDGSSFHPVQVVVPNTLANYADEVLKLTAGCAVEATGTIVPSPAKGQPFEMQASAIAVIGWVDDPDTYPIQPKPHSLEFLREVAHLRPRTNVIGAATSACGTRWRRRSIASSTRTVSSGSIRRSSPRPTRKGPARCSGCRRSISPICRARRKAKWISRKDFFGREAFLTVSGQLNVEAYCLALTKVYTFGPTFRAENSNTSRHLAEFWMVEPEIAFADISDDAHAGGTAAEIRLRGAAQGTARRSRLLRRAHREGAGGEAGRASSARNSCAWITPRRSRCSSGRRRNSSSR